jgi:hypothetical protein
LGEQGHLNPSEKSEGMVLRQLRFITTIREMDSQALQTMLLENSKPLAKVHWLQGKSGAG